MLSIIDIAQYIFPLGAIFHDDVHATMLPQRIVLCVAISIFFRDDALILSHSPQALQVTNTKKKKMCLKKERKKIKRRDNGLSDIKTF